MLSLKGLDEVYNKHIKEKTIKSIKIILNSIGKI